MCCRLWFASSPFPLHWLRTLCIRYSTAVLPITLVFTHLLSLQEMELLLHGLPNIDMDDWVKNTEYTGEFANSPGRLLRLCCAGCGVSLVAIGRMCV
jgi:hypothetical protein